MSDEQPGPIAAARARAAARAQLRVQDARRPTLEPGPPAPLPRLVKREHRRRGLRAPSVIVVQTLAGDRQYIVRP